MWGPSQLEFKSLFFSILKLLFISLYLQSFLNIYEMIKSIPSVQL